MVQLPDDFAPTADPRVLGQIVAIAIDQSRRRTFVYAGDGDYAGLFVDEDISAAVDELTPLVPGWVTRAREILGGEMPPVPVGRQCRNPYVSPLLDWCRACDGDVHVGYLPAARGSWNRSRRRGSRACVTSPRAG